MTLVLKHTNDHITLAYEMLMTACNGHIQQWQHNVQECYGQVLLPCRGYQPCCPSVVCCADATALLQ